MEESLPDSSKEKDEVRNRKEPQDRHSDLQNENYVKKSQNGSTRTKNDEPEKYKKTHIYKSICG